MLGFWGVGHEWVRWHGVWGLRINEKNFVRLMSFVIIFNFCILFWTKGRGMVTAEDKGWFNSTLGYIFLFARIPSHKMSAKVVWSLVILNTIKRIKFSNVLHAVNCTFMFPSLSMSFNENRIKYDEPLSISLRAASFLSFTEITDFRAIVFIPRIIAAAIHTPIYYHLARICHLKHSSGSEKALSCSIQ